MRYVMLDCPDCNGTGEIEVLVVGRGYGDPDGIYDVEDCEACGGMGEIETEQYEEEEDQ